MRVTLRAVPILIAYRLRYRVRVALMVVRYTAATLTMAAALIVVWCALVSL